MGYRPGRLGAYGLDTFLEIMGAFSRYSERANSVNSRYRFLGLQKQNN